ncbi:MAG: hypothetical protein LM517_07850 [Nitrosomonas sp.]|nr:hypothetical protein [Nitrosomonas sp.]
MPNFFQFHLLESMSESVFNRNEEFALGLPSVKTAGTSTDTHTVAIHVFYRDHHNWHYHSSSPYGSWRRSCQIVAINSGNRVHSIYLHFG